MSLFLLLFQYAIQRNVTALNSIGEGTEARFLSRKDRAALSKFDRESWHREQASAGIRSYASALSERWKSLYHDRKAELERLYAEVEKQGDHLRNGGIGVCIIEASTATDRLRLAVMGWAARLKAEKNIEMRMKVALTERDGNPTPQTQTDSRASRAAKAKKRMEDIQESIRRDMAPVPLMVLPDPEAQAAWERSKRRAA